ncbi:MAG: TetR/AcrR family transcriptional regulator [Panacagrimonas sp.]
MMAETLAPVSSGSFPFEARPTPFAIPPVPRTRKAMILDTHHPLHDATRASSAGPLVPVTPRGEATRRKLMSAAEDEFGSKGFHLASVSSITGRAGVGQGTFYLYFHTKEEIFVTLVREIGRDLRRALRGAAAEAGDQIEAERRTLEAVVAFARDRPGSYRIVQESQFVDEAAFREYYEHIAKNHAADLDAASQRGELQPGNAEARAWALMGLAHFMALRHGFWNRQAVPADWAVATMDLITNGIASRS